MTTPNYITPDQLRGMIGSDTNNFADEVATCCSAASRMVEDTCDRIFYQFDSPSTRRYIPENYYEVVTHDIATTDGLVVQVDQTYDGSYATTLTLDSDFLMDPPDGFDYANMQVPYSGLRIVGVNTTHNAFFPPATEFRQYTVKVTATFGWPFVPDEVTFATKKAAAWLFKSKDAPDGFIGLDGWGPRFYKDNPMIKTLLGPFMRNPIASA